jgi:putative DNA primase/helicase
MWNPELGLKIDDVLVKHGPEMVKKIMADAVPYPQWLKSLEAQMKESDSSTVEGTKKGKKELPPPSVIAEELAETYRDKLAWESEYQLWRHYSAKHEGLWGIETVETVKGLVHAHLRSKALPGFNAGYVSSIATILQSDLEVTDWDEQTGLIPLRDGVLNQLTQELKPHKPGYRFTWQLPFKWGDRAVGCEPIEEFLLKITGNQDIANVLLAYLSAIVTRRSDLQRYLELKGGGGTGKSTYMAIARGLTGDDNTVSSQLKHLENNQFETAKFYGKTLALFPDSERWQGEVSVLKQLTGQDPVRYERKGVQQCRDFIYKGMVILSANEAPESRDLTSGQERRKLTVELDIKVPEYEDTELPEKFKPFLPGLLKRVLDIPREEVTRLIKHTDREVPALARVKWKQLCETNPIAGWLDEKVVISPEATAYIGLGDLEQAGRWMYANFCKHQQENGSKNIIPMKRFSLNLRDLLKNQMKVAISEGRDRDGSYIKGLGLRCQLDPTGKLYPCPVTKKPFCDGFVMDCDGSVTVESLTDVGFDGYAGFLDNPQDTENFQTENLLEIQKNQLAPVDDGKNPANPAYPAPAKGLTSTNPSQNTENPSQSLPSDAVTRKQTGVVIGDLVEITLKSDYQGQKGKITDIGYGAKELDYYVKLEAEKVIVTVPLGADSSLYLRKL